MIEKAAVAYQNILHEIKTRLDAIETFSTQPLPIPNRVIEESCSLQLRLICELLAIGCLIAHEDLPVTRLTDLRKTYKADWILKELDKMHPRFFPQALEAGHVSNGQPGVTGEWVPAQKPSFGKNDLVKMYHGLGETLHRGSAKTIIDRDLPLRALRIQRSTNLFVNLLNCHTMTDRSEQTLWYCCIGATGARPSVQVFERADVSQRSWQPPTQR